MSTVNEILENLEKLYNSDNVDRFERGYEVEKLVLTILGYIFAPFELLRQVQYNNLRYDGIIDIYEDEKIAIEVMTGNMSKFRIRKMIAMQENSPVGIDMKYIFVAQKYDKKDKNIILNIFDRKDTLFFDYKQLIKLTQDLIRVDSVYNTSSQFKLELINELFIEGPVYNHPINIFKKIHVPMNIPNIKSKSVFIVHGHNNEMKENVTRIISQLGLNPVIMHETPNMGLTVVEKIERELEEVKSVVVLLDNINNSASSFSNFNNIFEMGYFMGRLGRSNVITLYLPSKKFRFPSDIAGINYIAYDKRGDWKITLCKELQSQGFSVSADQL